MTPSRPVPLPRLLAAALALALGAEGAAAQARPAPDTAARPRPYPVTESPEFARAVERGTRTRTGRPGPRYWTQHAQYRIAAELDPATRRVSGTGTVRYHNRSPDELRVLAVHLHPNLFAPDAVRNEEVPVVGGMELARVTAQGRTLEAVPALDTLGTPAYTVDGTVARIRLPQPLPSGSTAELGFTWSYVVPPDGAPRTGTDGDVYFVAYWYPQVAVYDDVSGWHTDPYMGNAEFYMGYADYDVSLTVPEGWLVGATGTLQNPEEVLSPQTRRRVEAAVRGRAVAHVVRAEDRGAGRATRTAPGGKLTWRFQASDVRDFAWGTSASYLWDATAALAGDADGDGRADTAAIHTFYRPERVQWAWDQSARYGQHSVEFLSRYLWPYGYPQMTVMDGPASCGGMEYPMNTCIGGRRDTLSLYSVTVHEIAHMWFPMQVGSDEKRYTWQDEGLTRFNQAQAMREFFRGYDLETIARNQYLALARRGGEHAGGEVELMRHGDRYPVGSPAYAIASYPKMATNLAMLRALLGEETFLRAYREYGRRWINRHPQPYDLFNTFEDVAGRDLDWFWRAWWYETWTLDQAIGEVRAAGDRLEVEVLDLGLAPMPARLAVTRADGRTERIEVPVEVWLDGARRHVVPVRDAASVVRVEIDPEGAFADVNRENQVWTRGR
jgi:hypothetical protein